MAEEEIVDETLDEGRLGVGEEEEKPRMSPETKKKVLIFGLAGLSLVSILGGGGAVLYVMMLEPSGGGAAIEEEFNPANIPTLHHTAEDLPIYHEFPELTVDIKSKGRRTRFVRIRMMAELYHQENLKHLISIQPKVIDGFQTHLRSQTSKQLSGSEGTKAMRDIFVEITNHAMGARHKINTILFREILVQ